jgi:hypothetical protein
MMRGEATGGADKRTRIEAIGPRKFGVNAFD